MLGKINLNNFTGLFGNIKIDPDRITGKGAAIIWIDPEKEPTKHIFNDLPLLKHELDTWGGYFIFLAGSSEDAARFKKEAYRGLPENLVSGVDDQMSLLKSISGCSASSDVSLPYVVMVDKNGNVLFKSAGYRIGIGEQILKYVK